VTTSPIRVHALAEHTKT